MSQPKGKAARGRRPPIRTQPPNARVLLAVMRDLSMQSRGEAKLDNVFWIMSQFGKVEKISIFTNSKDSKEQVLVQFETHDGAKSAMDYLNDKEVDTIGNDGRRWACIFIIVFSTVPQLTFKKANEQNQNYEDVNEAIKTQQVRLRYDFLWGNHRNGDGWLTPRQEPAMIGQIPKSTSILPQGKIGTCIYVSGLPDPVDQDTPTVTAEMLFRLCGQYGAVVAAKVLAQTHNAKKAIVQFQHEAAAEAMRKHFDNFEVFGQKITSRKSQLPNASNWSGALSEKWMFSLRNEESPTEAAEKITPTRAVLVLDWSANLEREISVILKRYALGLPRVFPQSVAGNASAAVLEFRTREDAFRLVGHLNGILYPTGAGNKPARIKMSFTRPLTPSPVIVEDKPPELVSPLGALNQGHMQMLNDGFSSMKARQVEHASESMQSIDHEGSSRTHTDVASLTIEDFLAELKLQRYTEMLQDEGFDYVNDLIGFENNRLEAFGLKPGHVNRIVNALRLLQNNAMQDKRSRTDPAADRWPDELEDPRAFSCPVQNRDQEGGGVFASQNSVQGRPTVPVVAAAGAAWGSSITPSVNTSFPGGRTGPDPAKTVEAYFEPGGHESVFNAIPTANSCPNSEVDGDDHQDCLASLEMDVPQRTPRDTKTLDGRAFVNMIEGTSDDQRSKTLNVFMPATNPED